MSNTQRLAIAVCLQAIAAAAATAAGRAAECRAHLQLALFTHGTNSQHCC
jgi:hypothetical protein